MGGASAECFLTNHFFLPTETANGGDDDDDDDEIGRLANNITKSGGGVSTPPSARVTAVASDPIEDTVEVSVPHARPAWIPKKVTAQYINQDGIKCWTVLIALTGGAIDEDNNGVEVEVTHDGNVLSVSETHLPDMLDVAGLCDSVAINVDGMSIARGDHEASFCHV